MKIRPLGVEFVCFELLGSPCLKKFLILIRTERDIITNVYQSACTVPIIIHDLIKIEFLGRFSKNNQI